jgi:uncharacterized membrane protein (UPF0127 family)
VRSRPSAGSVVYAASVLLLVAALGGYAALDLGLLTGDDYERTTVTLSDENGTKLATVDVRVADTFPKRYTGLSDTESLRYGEGMLFIHEKEGHYEYVMREMDFPLDIIFVDANGTVTSVHHAPVPSETPGDDLRRYGGYGKYVLEVPMGYANATGISEGDTVVIGSGDE